MSKLKEFLLSFPSFGWLLFFFFVPACVVYTCAFRGSDCDGTVIDAWTLDSIRNLLHSRSIHCIGRTLLLSLFTMVICVCIAVPVAYTMASASKQLQRKLLLLVVIPLWSSFLVRIFAWKLILHPEGIVKYLLVKFFIIDESTSLLYNNAAVLLVMCYSYLPFAILPLFSAASKFNFSLFEAAMDLGATRRQAFYKIFLPSMKRAMCTAGLMVLIPAAGAYVIPDVVGGKNSEMLGNLIAQKVFIDRNMPDASALSLLLSLLLFIPSISAATWKTEGREISRKRKKA